MLRFVTYLRYVIYVCLVAVSAAESRRFLEESRSLLDSDSSENKYPPPLGARVVPALVEVCQTAGRGAVVTAGVLADWRVGDGIRCYINAGISILYNCAVCSYYCLSLSAVLYQFSFRISLFLLFLPSKATSMKLWTLKWKRYFVLNLYHQPHAKLTFWLFIFCFCMEDINQPVRIRC